MTFPAGMYMSHGLNFLIWCLLIDVYFICINYIKKVDDLKLSNCYLLGNIYIFFNMRKLKYMVR